jgi:putative transport protein
MPGEVQLGAGLTVEKVMQNISVTYALTFLVADIAAILLSRSLPGWFKFDLKAESQKAAQEKNIDEGIEKQPLNWELTLRAYEVQNPDIVSKTIAELQKLSQCEVLSYKRDGFLRDFQPNTKLYQIAIASIF